MKSIFIILSLVLGASAFASERSCYLMGHSLSGTYGEQRTGIVAGQVTQDVELRGCIVEFNGRALTTTRLDDAVPTGLSIDVHARALNNTLGALVLSGKINMGDNLVFMCGKEAAAVVCP